MDKFGDMPTPADNPNHRYEKFISATVPKAQRILEENNDLESAMERIQTLTEKVNEKLGTEIEKEKVVLEALERHKDDNGGLFVNERLERLYDSLKENDAELV